MKFTYDIFITPKTVLGFEQLVGEEANAYLKKKGYKYIHVDNEGNIHALNKENQYYNGWKVYKRKVPVFE